MVQCFETKKSKQNQSLMVHEFRRNLTLIIEYKNVTLYIVSIIISLFFDLKSWYICFDWQQDNNATIVGSALESNPRINPTIIVLICCGWTTTILQLIWPWVPQRTLVTLDSGVYK